MNGPAQPTAGDDGAAILGEVPAPVGTPPSHRRRRLWEWPAEVHDVLLGLALPVDRLRRLARSAVSRVHGCACRLDGPDADLLYAVVQDLTARNPLSEALDRHLSQVFAPEIRDAEALRRWWAERPVAAVPVGAAWAALAHPLGATLQARVLFELKAWACTRARTAATAEAEAAALRRRIGDLSASVDRHRERTLALQRELDRHARELWSQRAVHAGERAAWQAGATAAEVHDAPPARPPAPVEVADGAGPGVASGPAPDDPRHRTPPAVAAGPGPDRGVDGPRSDAAQADTGATPAPAAPLPGVAGLRVLCVGGVRHAVSRYRDHAERLGARFEHHDGGVEDALPRLDGPLGRADLVVCQAGCINHEAYHRIKRHCARQGTACVFLERPSVARFALALGHHLPALAARRPSLEDGHAR